MTRMALALLLLSTGTLAMAQDVSLHGYVSQGLTQSVDSNFITDHNDISLELTEIGINGRVDINQSVSVVGQAVYLDGGNRFDKGARVDYLFIDWSLPEFAGWKTQLHIGRYKNRHWLYSATRDVPQTRATAVLPQSVYFDRFRDIALGSDGIQAQFKRFTDEGIWEIDWSYGRSDISDTQTKSLLGDIAQGRAKQDFVHQLSVYWQPADMSWRIGLSALDSDFRYEPAATDFLLEGTTDVDRLMLSIQYFSENWEFSSEILREYQTDTGVLAPDFYNRRIGEGGFAQFRYLWDDNFSMLLSFDAFYLYRNDKSGERLEAASGGTVPRYFGYMRTKSVGFRWDIAPRWRFQAEHHWVDGGARTIGFISPFTTIGTEPEWRMWSAQLMYWF
ncbi:hypothetical protein [Alteromonas halophila]|uniref:Uncharacterized protein n=1 Tax=Alteromonas halophila TaxID=516698 RepID=A0A918JKB4_9ALTE|nr:hypothetical protein [Alteromonas halophila]GGW85139.1 hypothetical protein GCM10007391_18760 [Alteromonas halophila]